MYLKCKNCFVVTILSSELLQSPERLMWLSSKSPEQLTWGLVPDWILMVTADIPTFFINNLLPALWSRNREDCDLEIPVRLSDLYGTLIWSEFSSEMRLTRVVQKLLRQSQFCPKDWTSFKTTYIVIKGHIYGVWDWIISLLKWLWSSSLFKTDTPNTSEHVPLHWRSLHGLLDLLSFKWTSYNQQLCIKSPFVPIILIR